MSSQRLSIGACTSLGFTTGIDDEDLSAQALEEIENHNGSTCRSQAELDKFGKDGRGYEARPGRTPKETLEENIMVILDLGKQAAGDVAKEELNQSGNSNAAVGMAISGARGSMDNLTMMAGSIGQAKVRSASRAWIPPACITSLQKRRPRCSRKRIHLFIFQERSRAN